MAKDPGDAKPLLGEDALLPTSVEWSRGSPSNFTPLDDQIGPQDRVIPDERLQVLRGPEGAHGQEEQDLCACD